MTDASLRFRMLGTPVEVGWTAALFMVLIGSSMGAGNWLFILVDSAIILGSILVHEQGHALVGKAVGLKVRRIVIHGMGGLCEFERAPKDREGLVTSIAGPLAGLLLAACCWALLLLLGGETVGALVTHGLAVGLWVNLVWSIFNLVPMFPLDGGQALLYGARLFLKRRFKAMRISRRISLVTAVLVGTVGIWMTEPFIVLIAGFCGVQTWQMGRRRSRR